MTALADKIAQFRKMATDDPDNELGHFRLGQLLLEDGQAADAVGEFRRTVELSPEFSKAHQLLGEALIKTGRTDEAVAALTGGWAMADGRGDKMPRDAMGKLLTELGAPIPVPAAPAAATDDDGPDTGFRCERPGCPSGKRARPLDKSPLAGEIGVRIQEHVCAGCWEAWFKDYSIKVINEMRLDLSNEFGAGEYDKHMREFFGFEDAPDPGGGMTASVAVVVRYGRPGYVGRFAACAAYPRGAAVVVRTPRGTELGTVLGDGDHAAALAAAGGDVLRPASADDRTPDAGELLDRATIAADGLPLTVVDAEVLLDRSAGVVHALVWDAFDGDALFADLSATLGYPVRLYDLANAGGPADPPEPSCGSGNCGTGCGTGGGCGSGDGCSRGAVKSADELTAYFLNLRQQMERAV